MRFRPVIAVSVSLTVLGGLLLLHTSRDGGHDPISRSPVRPTVRASLSAGPSSKPTPPACGATCQAYSHRLQRYCHNSLTSTRLGKEGRLPSPSAQLQLAQVHLMARHGDRSAARAGHLGSPVACLCGLPGRDAEWQGLRDFPLPHRTLNAVNRATRRVALYPGAGDLACGVGMLTRQGFKQHRALGRLMRAKFSDFISESREAVNETFVHSTSFPRTIQSAGAFLLGFLPDDPALRRQAHIYLSKHEFLSGSPVGIHTTHTMCRNYWKIWEEDKKNTGYYATEKKQFHHFVEWLCDMFGLQRRREQPIISELFDHIMVQGCHDNHHPLPCNRSGKCVGYPLARKLFHFADWSIIHKYPRRSAIMAMLPFIKHSLLEGMVGVVSGNSSSPKFMLYFSHDTTITQTLTALGYTLAEWPPYAARVVFELWRRLPALKSSETNYFVRVLLNGEPITNEFGISSHRSTFESKMDLVSFSKWQQHIIHEVAGNYWDPTLYNKKCGIL